MVRLPLGRRFIVESRRTPSPNAQVRFAVERMKRGNPERKLPPPVPDGDGGDEASESGVPRRPALMGGSAPAEVPEEDSD